MIVVVLILNIILRPKNMKTGAKIQINIFENFKLNISSINGQKGQMGQANYSAAKSGDIGFSKALAQEGAFKGITVNTICPGYIATDMVKAVPEKVREAIISQIPVGRLGEASEIARCVTFLASEEAGFITGSTITANGGQYIV